MSDEEHITFLALWLSRYIFSCKYLKVSKRYLTLANQLHKGRDICLGQLISGPLYESLDLATENLKNLQPKDDILLGGPYWLLYLWLNAMFEPFLDVEKLNDVDEDIKNMRIEGVRLSRITRVNTHRTYMEAFSKYFMLFDKRQLYPLNGPFC